MGGVELFELGEAVGVDDLLQAAVEVVPDGNLAVEDEALAVFCGVGLPFREAFDIRIAGPGEIGP